MVYKLRTMNKFSQYLSANTEENLPCTCAPPLLFPNIYHRWVVYVLFIYNGFLRCFPRSGFSTVWLLESFPARRKDSTPCLSWCCYYIHEQTASFLLYVSFRKLAPFFFAFHKNTVYSGWLNPSSKCAYYVMLAKYCESWLFQDRLCNKRCTANV